MFEHRLEVLLIDELEHVRVVGTARRLAHHLVERRADQKLCGRHGHDHLKGGTKMELSNCCS